MLHAFGFVPSGSGPVLGWLLLSGLLLTGNLNGQTNGVDFERRLALIAVAHEAYAADNLQESYRAYAAVKTDADGRELRDSLTALAYHKIGLIYYDYAEDSLAGVNYLRAVRLRDSLFPAPHNDRAHSRFDLATTLRYQGFPDSAIAYAREAAALYAAVPAADSVNWLRTFNELAECGLLARDLQVAGSATVSALNLAEQITGLKFRDRFDTYYTAGRTRLKFRDYAATRRLATEALAVAEGAERDDWLADALLLLASAQQELGRTDDARRSYRRGAELLTALEDPLEELPLIYLNLAVIAREAGRTEEALRLLEDARAATQSASPTTIRSIMQERGITLLVAERLPEALALFNDIALTIPGLARKDRPDPTRISSNDRIAASVLLAERARTHYRLEQFDAALRDYETYFALLENMRSGVNSDASRRYLSKNLRPYFDSAISLYVDRYERHNNEEDLWRALALSERARAYSLLTAVERNRATMPAREAALRAQIASLERSGSDDDVAELAAARLTLDRLLHQDSKLDTPTEELDAKAIRKWVGSQNASILVYHLTAGDDFVFHLSPTGQLSYHITDSLDLDRQSQELQEAILASAYRSKSLRPAAEQRRADQRYLVTGRVLCEQLIPQDLRAANLIIIPDGALTYLPFGALPLTSRDNERLDYAQDVDYLATSHQLSYAYAVRQLLSPPVAETPAYEHNLVAFAPTFGEGAAQKNNGNLRQISVKDLRALRGLRPLRYNEEEVRTIVDIVPGGRPLVGTAASRDNFLARIGSGRILHLSTHGVMNAADPNLSFVAFTQRGDSLELDELLYFNDLSALPLRTELAVLSACETNLGEYVPGEVALSMASAFTAAGARSTLTTLWSVDDAATKELMIRFYRHLAAGSERVVALAAAQAEMIASQEYAHPFHWSALTLYGDRHAIAFSSGSSRELIFWLGGVVAGILLVGLLIWWGKR